MYFHRNAVTCTVVIVIIVIVIGGLKSMGLTKNTYCVVL
jgi:hypothetical protein